LLPADLVRIQIWISTVGSLLELLLIVRILQLRLFGRYRAFLAFLICDLGRDLCLRLLERDMSSGSYAIAWAASAPILWIPLVFAVAEISRRFFSEVSASREVRWMLVGAAVLASVVITLAISAELIDSVSALASWQDLIRVSNRFVFMAGAVILWTQRLYFFRIRPILPHNLQVHRNAFTLYLSADASLRFVSGLRDPAMAMRANIGCSVLFCASLLIWVVGFRQQQHRVPTGEISSSEAEASRRIV
jgi:hypothetical protein